MSHYLNAREAKVGDPVICLKYFGQDTYVAGVLSEITSTTPDVCNAIVVYPTYNGPMCTCGGHS